MMAVVLYLAALALQLNLMDEGQGLIGVALLLAGLWRELDPHGSRRVGL